MSAPLPEVVQWLDHLLDTPNVPDYPGAHNGLQVESTADVSKVVTAVDACQASIDHAASVNADLLLVHHGLFWDNTRPVTGRRYRRLHALLSNRIALYSSHLPLDAHDTVGNNVLLAQAVGLRSLERFGNFQDVDIGRRGTWSGSLSQLVQQVESATGTSAQVIDKGPTPNQVGVITGGGGSAILEAAEAGLDTLVTGEGAHHSFFDAEEAGMNVVYAGHYATETFGVRAVGERLNKKFGVECEFFDHPTGL